MGRVPRLWVVAAFTAPFVACAVASVQWLDSPIQLPRRDAIELLANLGGVLLAIWGLLIGGFAFLVDRLNVRVASGAEDIDIHNFHAVALVKDCPFVGAS